MDQQELYDRLGTELIGQLAQAKCVEELARMAEAQHKSLRAEEAQSLFEALTPLREKRPIDDADLLAVSGGNLLDCKPPKINFITPKIPIL